MEVSAQLPTSFYVVVGVLIIFNLGSIGSVLVSSWRLTWWLSKLDSRVEYTENIAKEETGAKAMAIRSHKRIDKLEE